MSFAFAQQKAATILLTGKAAAITVTTKDGCNNLRRLVFIYSIFDLFYAPTRNAQFNTIMALFLLLDF